MDDRLEERAERLSDLMEKLRQNFDGITDRIAEGE